MKTLYLIRHAKSDSFYPSQVDFKRGLSEKGEQDIKKVWKYLKGQHIYPDLVLSSPAQRAKLTAEWICKKIKYKKKYIEYRNEIYDSHMSWHEVSLATIMELWIPKISPMKKKFSKLLHNYVRYGSHKESILHTPRKKIKKWYEGGVDTLFFIWHNPAISEFASFLSWKDMWNVSTCSVIGIEFDTNDWSDIATKKGKVTLYITPKNL